jgi:hypothetical protein
MDTSHLDSTDGRTPLLSVPPPASPGLARSPRSAISRSNSPLTAGPGAQFTLVVDCDPYANLCAKVAALGGPSAVRVWFAPRQAL